MEAPFRTFVNYLNNPEEHGGYYLPNIQRPFVWKEDQIEKLFDSILREYPIGTLLVWKTRYNTKTRKFIENYKKDIKLSDFENDPNGNQKMLVLDGQQRLQSLFIGLKGKYNEKELYFDLLSGIAAPPEDVKYVFKFLKPDEAELPFVKLKDLVYANEPSNRIVEKYIAQFNELDDENKQKIDDNIHKVNYVFVDRDHLLYQIIDSIDKPTLYSDEDVVEIFIRANSGGTKLEKSDLLFSLLVSSWEDAGKEMEDFLISLNISGFKFTRDFILKACLCILEKGAAYNVDKFRKSDIKEKLIENWMQITSSIKKVKDFLDSNTFIRADKTLPSYNVLIPLVYFNYHFSEKWDATRNIDEYIIRSLMSGAFSGSSDTILDNVNEQIKKNEDFILKNIFSIIREQGRNLEVSKDNILNQQYGTGSIHLFLNLWYDFNYSPSFVGNIPNIDHIFPQSLLKSIKVINPETGRNIQKYRGYEIDQIANCMLLTKTENGAGGKTDIPPNIWFADKDESYLEKHLIPKDKSLWEVDNYEIFIEERKKLILDKFKEIILKEE